MRNAEKFIFPAKGKANRIFEQYEKEREICTDSTPEPIIHPFSAVWKIREVHRPTETVCRFPALPSHRKCTSASIARARARSRAARREVALDPRESRRLYVCMCVCVCAREERAAEAIGNIGSLGASERTMVIPRNLLGEASRSKDRVIRASAVHSHRS